MKTKYISAVLLLAMLLVGLCPLAAFASYDVVVDHDPVDLDTYVSDKGYLMAPVRPLALAMGMWVDYDAAEKCIYLLYDRQQNASHGELYLYPANDTFRARVQHDDARYCVTTQTSQMAVPCANIKGTVYVPVRFVCNVFGAPVRLDTASNTVYIGAAFTAEGKSQDRVDNMIAPVPKEESSGDFIAGLLGLLFCLWVVWMFFKTLVKYQNRPATPFDKKLDLPVRESGSSIRTKAGEQTLFEGEAFYCYFERMVVGEEQHGYAMALPDSHLLYEPVDLKVEYQYGNVLVFHKGTLTITQRRLVFWNPNQSFELDVEDVARLELFVDGFVFMARGDNYYMRLTDMSAVSRAIYAALGYNGVVDHTAGKGEYLFPNDKTKIHWQDGDQ